METKKPAFDIIQIIPAQPGILVWSRIEGRTFIDPVPAFAMVEYADQKHAVFPMIARKDKPELIVVDAGGLIEYRAPWRQP